ncbi:hypothetical protein [Microbacterium sp. NPDC076895]|uniref:hypothetical protein n=1 Tax=Microbacterium sp. NPDC076895 TaxID=3154957 RepID=UPI00343549E2
MDAPRKRIVIAGAVLLVLLFIGLVIWLWPRGEDNQYGEGVEIGGYSGQVNNLPSDYLDGFEAALLKMVRYNGISDAEASDIRDATIRDGSAKQTYLDGKGTGYSGSFIVDIASIKQSYEIQYEYAAPNTGVTTSGYPVLVNCLDTDQLIYGDFGCKNLYAAESEDLDPLVSHLPYKNLTYQINADSTAGGDKLRLNVKLSIPDIDLSGDEASRRQTITLYKAEVTKWISSQGVDPANYDIHYNYSDTGERVE